MHIKTLSTWVMLSALLGLVSCKGELKTNAGLLSKCAVDENADPCFVSNTFSITPKDPSLKAGIPSKFKVEGTYKNGVTKNVSHLVTWEVLPAKQELSKDPSAEGDEKSITPDNTSDKLTIKAKFKSSEATLIATVAKLKSISIVPTEQSMAIDQVQQYSATGLYSDGSSEDITNYVTWDVDSRTVGDFLDQKASPGKFTALASGSTTITATLLDVAGTTQVVVQGGQPSSLTLTPSNPSLHVIMTRQFTLQAIYPDGSSRDVTNAATWSSASTSVARFETPSASGLVTAHTAGSAVLSASFSGLSASTTLTVYPAILTSIAVTPSNPATAVGLTRQFTATATYADGSTADVTTSVVWSSSDASKGTINASSGLATGVSAGSTTISASGLTYTGDSGMTAQTTGSTTLTVTAASIVSISVTATSASIPVGLTEQLVATATLTDSSTQDVSAIANWTSSVPAKATVSSSGLVTAVATGSTDIAATYSGVTSNNSAITVTVATLSSIALSPSSVASLPLGLTQAFVATGTYSDGTTADITGSVSWSSSFPARVSIASGTATAVSLGASSITATLSGRSASASVTAVNPTLVSIAVTPSNATVAKGLTQQMVATGTYSDASTANVTTAATWTSNHASVSISNSSGTEGLATAQNIGSATLTATVGAVSGNTSLTVGAATLASIAVTPANTSVALGLTQQFTATGTYTDSSTADLTGTTTWSKTNGTGSANISVGGLATTIGQGTVTITATTGAVSGSTTLTVAPKSLVSIAVTPSNPTVAIGLTQQFTATGTYTDSSTQDISGTVTWSKTNGTGSATISVGGLVTTTGTGTVTITATSGAVSGNTTLTVGAATIQSIALSPTNPTITYGGTQQFTATATYSDASTSDISASATWASATTGTATIDANGLATSAGIGSSNITATQSGVTSPAQSLTVSAQAAPPNPTISSTVADSTSQITISWSSGGGTTSAYKVAYQSGGTAPADCSSGTVVNPAASPLPVSGLSTGTQYSFRVCALNGNPTADVSSGVTSTQTTQSLPATITLVVPNGGETWYANSSPWVHWDSSNLVGNVKIESSTDGGSTWSTVAASVANSSPYTWTPTVTTTQGRIRVSSVNDAGVNDSSNANFTVATGPGITLLNPNLATSFYHDSTITVQWTSTGLTGTMVTLGGTCGSGGLSQNLANAEVGTATVSIPVCSLETGNQSLYIAASGHSDSPAVTPIATTRYSACRNLATSCNSYCSGLSKTCSDVAIATDNVHLGSSTSDGTCFGKFGLPATCSTVDASQYGHCRCD